MAVTRPRRWTLKNSFPYTAVYERMIINDASATILSVISTFTVKEPKTPYRREENAIWNLLDFHKLPTALEYKGLTEATRESLVAAPVREYMEVPWNSLYAKRCDFVLHFYSNSGESPSPSRVSCIPFHEDLNMDQYDHESTAKTLRSQIKFRSGTAGDVYLTEQGREMYALNVVSVIGRKLFEHFGPDGNGTTSPLPKTLPESIKTLLPCKVRPHAEDNWALISGAYSSGMVSSSIKETLVLEKENRKRLFHDWSTWRERGSRSIWLEKQIKEGIWEQIAPWIQRNE